MHLNHATKDISRFRVFVFLLLLFVFQKIVFLFNAFFGFQEMTKTEVMHLDFAKYSKYVVSFHKEIFNFLKYINL